MGFENSHISNEEFLMELFQDTLQETVPVAQNGTVYRRRGGVSGNVLRAGDYTAGRIMEKIILPSVRELSSKGEDFKGLKCVPRWDPWASTKAPFRI